MHEKVSSNEIIDKKEIAGYKNPKLTIDENSIDREYGRLKLL